MRLLEEAYKNVGYGYESVLMCPHWVRRVGIVCQPAIKRILGALDELQ